MPRLALVVLLLALPIHAADVHIRVDPAAPPAAPGNEDRATFPTIQNALDHHPFATPNRNGSPGRVFIEIVPGTYHERVIITQNHPNITLLGLGKSPSDVVITNSLNAKSAGGTFFTETLEINGANFEADNLTIENAAGNTGQAVAVANRSDRSIFKHCRLLGHQDTLFADFGRQYYVDSYIRGGVDFIFGNATAVFDHDTIEEIRLGYLTAQSRTSPVQTTGYVITNSRVISSIDPSTKTPQRSGFFLGRPWRLYSRVIFMNTELPADLDPQGWSVWNKSDAYPPQAFYAEFHNTGPGWRPGSRVPWSHQLTAAEAKAYEAANFLRGTDHWNTLAAAAKLP
jgi:pectinesterase